MLLPSPLEPSKSRLLEMVDTPNNTDRLLEAPTGDDWKLKKAVLMYLLDCWKEPLKQNGMTWGEFQSISAMWAIETLANVLELWAYVFRWHQEGSEIPIIQLQWK